MLDFCQKDFSQQLDFCHKELLPKSFVNPRHTSDVIDKKLLEDITLVNYFFNVSMIVEISAWYNPEKP